MRVEPLELAVVGNCEVSALLDQQGRVVWMCLPRPDGDPVFCALLTPELGASARGVFALELADLAASQQVYERNTAIVETTLHDAHGGAITITDFCPRFRARGRIFRPRMLVRIVRPVSGRPLLRIRLKPTMGNGARDAEARPGSHHVRYVDGDAGFRVTTDVSISALVRDRPIAVDRPLAFILGPDETVEEMPSTLALQFLEQTREYWQDWVRQLAIPFDWQAEVIRAAITLKLCTYEDTGALLAALTTSIPESPDNSGRTWDYRFCWLRDSYFVVQALNRLGATRTMEGYLHYIDHIVASVDTDVRPVYPITGEGDMEEHLVPHLPGFLGMGPVRVGNQAGQQIQYDVYGAVIMAASQLFFDERLAYPGGQALFSQLEALGERAAQVCELPDAGPWEFRGAQRVHTFSAAMSWAGCDRLARIAGQLGLPAARRWQERAGQMRERILAWAWSERRGTFVGSRDGDELDATALLLPELGLLPATDPRFRATVEAIGRELRDGDLLFRYRHPDDFGRPQSAFTVCAFWYVSALAGIGRVEEAREHFTRLLARRTRLGLLSEDIDPRTGALWGNFPQTYSMVGVINSAVRLSRSWDEAL